MSKILLVEDDNNLREIYEARLQAEGYAIVSAHDGEEALAIAKTEKPDLIISDVMMPKISGFEMLDILRNTDSLKNVKIIMLTALGQSDDQQRANKLGANRYLVKSQVTLEDIVKAANDLLGPPASTATAPTPTISTPPQPTTTASTASPAPAQSVTPSSSAPSQTAPDAEPSNQVPLPPTMPTTPISPAPVAAPTTSPTAPANPQNDAVSQINNFMVDQLKNEGPPPATPEPSTGMKVIQPLPENQVGPTLSELLAQEDKNEAQTANSPSQTSTAPDTSPPAAPLASSPDKVSVDPNNIAL